MNAANGALVPTVHSVFEQLEHDEGINVLQMKDEPGIVMAVIINAYTLQSMSICPPSANTLQNLVSLDGGDVREDATQYL
ncbi:uncharacterized protein ANIA_11480 [Aspergillus nidulans FGSC A4]|uniref:Uncharacterized protein n=1 Tax=Emericella nidulans (strain FGSC A4 / ATCC 38163 / CBS 112.46 / NRRL 194 / M139) TaxID=227321 RepID=C8VGF7_EMENI|nr:hypothetical protein [Aspergillus nidulans FGSC A4]CBF81864.1 TPA: hypothetical protein ANIA_11480 [Aspergillus nidulans FGSC A4]